MLSLEENIAWKFHNSYYSARKRTSITGTSMAAIVRTIPRDDKELQILDENFTFIDVDSKIKINPGEFVNLLLVPQLKKDEISIYSGYFGLWSYEGLCILLRRFSKASIGYITEPSLDVICLEERFHSVDIVKDMANELINKFVNVPNQLIERIEPNIRVVDYKRYKPDARF